MENNKNISFEIDLDNWRNAIKTQINEKLSRLSGISQSSMIEYNCNYPTSLESGAHIGTNKLFVKYYHGIFADFESYYTVYRYVTTTTAYLTNGSVESTTNHTAWSEIYHGKTCTKQPGSRHKDRWT